MVIFLTSKGNPINILYKNQVFYDLYFIVGILIQIICTNYSTRIRKKDKINITAIQLSFLLIYIKMFQQLINQMTSNLSQLNLNKISCNRGIRNMAYFINHALINVYLNNQYAEIEVLMQINIFIIFYYSTHITLTKKILIQQLVLFTLLQALRCLKISKNSDVNVITIIYISISPSVLFILFQCIRKSKTNHFNQLFSQTYINTQIKESFQEIKRLHESQIQKFRLKLTKNPLSSDGIVVCIKIQSQNIQIEQINAMYCYIEELTHDQEGIIIELSPKYITTFFECFQTQHTITSKLHNIINVGQFILKYLQSKNIDVGIGIAYGSLQHKIIHYGKLTKIIRFGVEIQNAQQIASRLVNRMGINLQSFKKQYEQMSEQFQTIKVTARGSIEQQFSIKPNYKFEVDQTLGIVIVNVISYLTLITNNMLLSQSQTLTLGSTNSSIDTFANTQNNIRSIKSDSKMPLRNSLTCLFDDKLKQHHVKQNMSIPKGINLGHTKQFPQRQFRSVIDYDFEQSDYRDDNINSNSLSTVNEIDGISDITNQNKGNAQQEQNNLAHDNKQSEFSLTLAYIQFMEKLLNKYKELCYLQSIIPVLKYLTMDNKLQLYGNLVCIIMLSSTLLKYRAQIQFDVQNSFHEISILNRYWSHIYLYQIYKKFIVFIILILVITCLGQVQLQLLFQKKLHNNTAQKHMTQMHTIHKNLHYIQLLTIIMYFIIQIVLIDAILELFVVSQEYLEFMFVTQFLCSQALCIMIMNSQFIQTMYMSPEYVPLHYKIFMVYSVYFVLTIFQKSPTIAINYLYHNLFFYQHSFYNLMVQLTNYKKMFRTKCIIDDVIEDLTQYQMQLTLKGYFIKLVSQFEYLQYNIFKNLDIKSMKVDFQAPLVGFQKKQDIQYIQDLNKQLYSKTSRYFILHAKNAVIIEIQYKCSIDDLNQFFSEIQTIQSMYPSVIHFVEVNQSRAIFIAHNQSEGNERKLLMLLYVALDFCFLIRYGRNSINMAQVIQENNSSAFQWGNIVSETVSDAGSIVEMHDKHQKTYNYAESDIGHSMTSQAPIIPLQRLESLVSGPMGFESLLSTDDQSSVRPEQLRSLLISSSASHLTYTYHTSMNATSTNAETKFSPKISSTTNLENTTSHSSHKHIYMLFTLTFGTLNCGGIGNKCGGFGYFGDPVTQLELMPDKRYLNGSITSSKQFLQCFRYLGTKFALKNPIYSPELIHNGRVVLYTRMGQVVNAGATDV